MFLEDQWDQLLLNQSLQSQCDTNRKGTCLLVGGKILVHQVLKKLKELLALSIRIVVVFLWEVVLQDVQNVEKRFLSFVLNEMLKRADS